MGLDYVVMVQFFCINVDIEVEAYQVLGWYLGIIYRLLVFLVLLAEYVSVLLVCPKLWHLYLKNQNQNEHLYIREGLKKTQKKGGFMHIRVFPFLKHPPTELWINPLFLNLPFQGHSRRIHRGAVNLFLFRHCPSKIFWKCTIWNINIQYKNDKYTLQK